MLDPSAPICIILRLLKPDTHTSRRCGSSQFTTSAPQIKQGYFDLGLRGRRGLLPPFPHRLQARLLLGRINSNQDGFCFCPLADKNVTKSGIAYNGCGFTNLRGGHDACASVFSKRSDRRAGWATAPSDDQREERRVNPLLYEVAVSVQPPALPRTAGPRIARGNFKKIPTK